MGLETAAIIGIAAAGAAAVGSVGNVIAQNSANKQNAQNVANTNALNYQIFQEQKAYQTGEREATQEYNTPLNQRQRYEQAGINPYFALGSIEGGNTTAMSSPSANPMQAAQIQPLPFGDILSSLSGGADKYLQYEAIQLDNDAKRVDNQFRISEKLITLSRQRQEVYNSKLDAKAKERQIAEIDEQIGILKKENDFLSSTMSERKRAVALNNKAIELSNRSDELQNEWQELQNNILRDTSDSQKATIRAQFANILSSTSLNSASAANQIADKMLKAAQENGVKIDNFQKNKINWLIREGVKLDNEQKRYNIDEPTFVHKLMHNNTTKSNHGNRMYNLGRKRGYNHGYMQGNIDRGKVDSKLK